MAAAADQGQQQGELGAGQGRCFSTTYPLFTFQKATQLLVIGGKSFIVDDEGNEEELQDNSKHSVLSEESGFNEEADDGGEGEGEHTQHTQLLYTRKNDRKSFTEYFSNDNSSDKSAK